MTKGPIRRALEILDDFGSVRELLRDLGLWTPLVTAGAAVLGYLWAQSAGISMPYRALLVANVVVLGLFTGLCLHVWSHVRRAATPEELQGAHISHRHFRIVDLAREEDLIRNRTFEDCTIYGPAVLFPIGNFGGFLNCSFGVQSARELSWPLENTERHYHGAIGLEGCVFRRCRFVRIGLAATDAMRQNIEANVRRQ
jgi:hypothetical protein